MKKIIFLWIVLLSFSALGAEIFVPGTEDIPLMDGLKANPVANMDFDTPEGQIMTINAVGKNLTGKEIMAYYRQVLPQMGWKEKQSGHFTREHDSISITVLRGKKPALVRFETETTNTEK